LAQRYRQIKTPLSFQARFLIGDLAIKRFRSQSRREEAFDPTPRFAGLDQKKIFLCDLRASAVNLILREEAIEWKK
jgi:hypothetical protein